MTTKKKKKKNHGKKMGITRPRPDGGVINVVVVWATCLHDIVSYGEKGLQFGYARLKSI